jgi:DNA-binding transcriptional ArsR family regulator
MVWRMEFRLDVADLAETTFAFSALSEITMSLRAWRFPALHPEHLPGLNRMREAHATLDLELLDALVTDDRWIPDFLTPRPSPRLPGALEALAQLRATPPEVVRSHVRITYAGRPLPPVLETAETDPVALLARIASAFEQYWDRCLAPWWPRMHAVLEADIIHRARTLALGGAQALFADLDDRVSWRNGTLTLTYPSNTMATDQSVVVGGRGLVLTPSLFARGAVSSIDGTEPPAVMYPARGRATVWEQADVATSAALEELLGRTRSRLLTMLEHPASTTEPATTLGVTPGAVSRHLTALHRAGLLNRARTGRSVLYVRSPLGDALHGT